MTSLMILLIEEANEALADGYGVDVEFDGDDILDAARMMSPPMDVLQCLGVDVVDAANFSSNVNHDAPIFFRDCS